MLQKARPVAQVDIFGGLASLVELIPKAGHLVLTYNTPQEALQALAEMQDVPDTIFLFLGYEKSAFDLIKYVKSSTKYAQTQMVAMVLQEEKTGIQRMLNEVQVSYLVKPFQVQEALALVSAPLPASAASSGTVTQ